MSNRKQLEQKKLLTIPQTFSAAIDLLEIVVGQVDGDGKQAVLQVAEYMRAVVEAQSATERLTEAALQNLETSIKQRDYALRVMSLWQESGTQMATASAAEMIARVLSSGDEIANEEDVQRALNRLLGFDGGMVPEKSLTKFFEAVDEVTRAVEAEKSNGDSESDIA